MLSAEICCISMYIRVCVCVCFSLQKKPEDRPKYEALLKHKFVSHLMTTPIDISIFVCDMLDRKLTTNMSDPTV